MNLFGWIGSTREVPPEELEQTRRDMDSARLELAKLDQIIGNIGLDLRGIASTITHHTRKYNELKASRDQWEKRKPEFQAAHQKAKARHEVLAAADAEAKRKKAREAERQRRVKHQTDQAAISQHDQDAAAIGAALEAGTYTGIQESK